MKANPILYRIEVKRVSSTSVPDPRGPRSEIPLSDALMAGLGVFGLKYPSLLKFDEASREGVMRYNLNTLYGVERAPCDTRSTTTIPQILPYAGISVLSHRGNGNTTVRDFDFAILAVWFLLLVALAGPPGEKPPSYPLNQRRNGKALSSLSARGGGLPVEVTRDTGPGCGQPCARRFERCIGALQRHKTPEAYCYLDGYHLVSVDGTGQFASTAPSMVAAVLTLLVTPGAIGV